MTPRPSSFRMRSEYRGGSQPDHPGDLGLGDTGVLLKKIQNERVNIVYCSVHFGIQ